MISLRWEKKRTNPDCTKDEGVDCHLQIGKLHCTYIIVGKVIKQSLLEYQMSLG